MRRHRITRCLLVDLLGCAIAAAVAAALLTPPALGEDRTAHTEYCFALPTGGWAAEGDTEHSHEPGDFLYGRGAGGCTYVPQDSRGGYWAVGTDWRLTLYRDGAVTVLSPTAGDPQCRRRGYFRSGDRVVVEAERGTSIYVGSPKHRQGLLHAGHCGFV